MNYNEYINKMTENNPKIVIGDDVIILVDYLLFVGKVLKVNKKSIKVNIPANGCFKEHTKSCSPEKVLKFGTPAVLVWEQWKGVNGRGGYRLETLMYNEFLKPIETIPKSNYLYEKLFGVLT